MLRRRCHVSDPSVRAMSTACSAPATPCLYGNAADRPQVSNRQIGRAPGELSLLAGDAVADESEHARIGAGEPSDALTAVATQQFDRHRGSGAPDHLPHGAGLLPAPQFGDPVDVHCSTVSR